MATWREAEAGPDLTKRYPRRGPGSPGWWSLAIDFGTSFTVAAMEVGDQVEILEIDNSRYMPSVVCLDDDDSLLVGSDAVEEAAADPARTERLPKRALATSDHVRLGDRTVATVDLVAAVLARVAGEAVRRRSGRPPNRVVLTHPARWRGDGVELDRLMRAAAAAGLGEPDLVAEPVAAAHHYAEVSDSSGEQPVGEAIAIYDLGGGTFDTAVLRRTANGFALAGPPGGDQHLGGEDLDTELMEIVAGHAEAIDADRWATLWEDPEPEAERDRNALRRAVTRARHSLSGRTTTKLIVPGFGEMLRITRGEYEKSVDEILRRSVREMAETVRRAGFTTEALAALYLTGGASRTPRIDLLLDEELGLFPVKLDDPKAVVAQGALAATVDSITRRDPPTPPPTPTSTAAGETVVTGRRPPADRPRPAADDAAGPAVAAELEAIAAAAGVGDIVGTVAPDRARLAAAIAGILEAIGRRRSPFPGLPPDIAVQVLREGREELGELGDVLDHLDRVAARLGAPARDARPTGGSRPAG